MKNNYPGIGYIIPGSIAAENVLVRKGGLAFNVGKGTLSAMTSILTADGSQKTTMRITKSTKCASAPSLCKWLRQTNNGPDRGFGETEFAIMRYEDFKMLRSEFMEGRLTIGKLLSLKHPDTPKLKSVTLFRKSFDDKGALTFGPPKGTTW